MDCVQDVGEMNWGSIVQMLWKPIQLLLLFQFSRHGGVFTAAQGRCSLRSIGAWMSRLSFFCKRPGLSAIGLSYFVVAPTISWMLKRKEHGSLDVFNKGYVLMCSWERSKRLHSRNMYKRTHLSIPRFGQRLIVKNIVFFIPKYHKIYVKVRIWHRRTMQLLKPDQPIMVSKDEVSLWEYKFDQFDLNLLVCWRWRVPGPLDQLEPRIASRIGSAHHPKAGATVVSCF